MDCPSRRGGFTLVELAVVCAILAVLVGATTPLYTSVLAHARAAEAHSTAHAIAHAEQRYFRDNGQFLACGEAGAPPVSPEPFPAAECWGRLGVTVSGTVRYRYSVALDGSSFVVLAEGDLDGDGQRSRFELPGRTLQMRVVDELE